MTVGQAVVTGTRSWTVWTSARPSTITVTCLGSEWYSVTSRGIMNRSPDATTLRTCGSAADRTVVPKASMIRASRRMVKPPRRLNILHDAEAARFFPGENGHPNGQLTIDNFRSRMLGDWTPVSKMEGPGSLVEFTKGN